MNMMRAVTILRSVRGGFACPGMRRACGSFIKVAALMCTLWAVTPVTAQETTPTPTPTPTPESEELRRLREANDLREQEKRAAELERDKLKAEKESSEARFPKPTATPLEGKTKIDGVFIESEMLTYTALSRAADLLACRMNVDKPFAIAVHSDRDTRLLQTYHATAARLEALEKRYRELITGLVLKDKKGQANIDAKASLDKDLSPDPISVGTSILGSFVNLVSYFRTEEEVKGQKVTVTEAALVAEVFRALRGNKATAGAKLYHPSALPPELSSRRESQLLTTIETLYKERERAEKLTVDFNKIEAEIARLKGANERLRKLADSNQARIETLNDEVAKLENAGSARNSSLIAYYKGRKLLLEKEKDTALDEIKKNEAALEKEEQNKSALDDRVVKLKALNQQFDKLIEEFTKAGDGTGVNVITSLLQAENLQAAMKNNPGETDTDKALARSYWLKLSAVSAGGNNRIKTNLIKDVFTGSNLSHSGGVIVEYNLFDMTGDSKAAGTLRCYTKYVKAKNVAAQENREKVLCVADP